MTWHVITGGAGFVGVNLAGALLARGDRVFVIDDLSLGRQEHVAGLGHRDRVMFRLADVSDAGALVKALSDLPPGVDVEVWHLCANSDIKKSLDYPGVDLRSTFLSTFTILNVMRARGWGT